MDTYIDSSQKKGETIVTPVKKTSRKWSRVVACLLAAVFILAVIPAPAAQAFFPSQPSTYTSGPKHLVSIRIVKGPDRTEYLQGEKFKTNGMLVAADFSDGTSKYVTEYTFNPEYLYYGMKKVEIRYTFGGISCTADVKVSVSSKWIIGCTQNPISVIGGCVCPHTPTCPSLPGYPTIPACAAHHEHSSYVCPHTPKCPTITGTSVPVCSVLSGCSAVHTCPHTPACPSLPGYPTIPACCVLSGCGSYTCTHFPKCPSLPGYPTIPLCYALSGYTGVAEYPTTPRGTGIPVVTPAPAAPVCALPFRDITATDAQYEIIKFLYEKGIMKGVSEIQFDKNARLTRSMLACILYNAEGCPSIGYAGKFCDVPAGEWYTCGVEWAASMGIIQGYDNGKFGPTDPVTREQMAAILYRCAVRKGYGMGIFNANIGDAGKISGYAVDAVNWAAQNNILLTCDARCVRPLDCALRWEVAVAIYTFLKSIAA